MKARIAVALACLAAAGAARADDDLSFELEATVGGQHLGIERTPDAGTLQPMGDLGATALLGLGPFALGVASEGTFDHGSLQRFDASALGGLVVGPVLRVRLELLGEIGAADLRSVGELRTQVAAGTWNRFYGFRPGLSLALPVLPVRIGVWGLARWGLPGTGPGPSYGLLGRVGIDF